jgi:hypothetical protein
MEQKRFYVALALVAMAALIYDIPGFLQWYHAGTEMDRVVSNTVEGDMQTVIMDLSKPDYWAMHGWVRQVCYAILCIAIMVVSKARAGVVVGLGGLVWYSMQAWDAYKAGNVFDDGWWEYGALAALIVGCWYFIKKSGS